MEKNYKIITDPDHGYLRVDPIPSQEEVEKYYLEEFYSSEYKSFNDSSLEVQQEEKEFFDSRWEATTEICEKHFGKLEGISIFDIGFGFAQALAYFKDKGLDVSGLEPSPEGFAHARSLGLEVYQSGIEDFSCVGNKRFDVVTLVNVLEHLRNPAQTLKNIKAQLLKSKGLLIIDVPNEFNDFQTVANKEFELNDWWICPPNHINYFSATSLKGLLKESGYEVLFAEASFPLEMFMLMGDVYVGKGDIGKLCHQKRVKFEYLMKKHGMGEKLDQLYRTLANMDLGRQVVIYAIPSQALR